MARFRRKNRQVKLVVDIPEDYDDDEAFMEDFMDKLDAPARDGTNWKFVLGEDDNIDVPIKRITLGEVEIEPEEDEEMVP